MSAPIAAPSTSGTGSGAGGNDEDKKRNDRDVMVWQSVARGLDTIKGMEYTKQADKMRFVFVIAGNTCLITTRANCITMYQYIGVKVADNNRPQMARYITAMNHTMELGNWEMDHSDGETRLKLSFPVMGGETLVHRLLKTYLVSLNKQYKANVDDIVRAAKGEAMALPSGGAVVNMGGTPTPAAAIITAVAPPIVPVAVPAASATPVVGIAPISGVTPSSPPPPSSSPASGVTVNQLDIPDVNGETPLFAACRNGHLDAVVLLLNRGATIDYVNHKGTTPLLGAVTHGRLPIVAVLVARGANVNKSSTSNDTPLSLAVFKNHEDISLLLLERGADFNHVDKFGDTPLLDACKFGMKKVVTSLISRGANVNHRNNEGHSPLSRAKANEEITKMLVMAGAR